MESLQLSNLLVSVINGRKRVSVLDQSVHIVTTPSTKDQKENLPLEVEARGKERVAAVIRTRVKDATLAEAAQATDQVKAKEKASAVLAHLAKRMS